VAVQIPFDIFLDTSGQRPVAGVSPHVGTIGTTFTFFAEGWPEGDPVDYWVMAPGQREPFALGKIYGDPDDLERTTWKWEVPADAWEGTWTMNARGLYSELAFTIPFIIEGPPPPTGPTINAIPTAGIPGETLTFIASGFQAEEEVSYWVTAPSQNTPIYSSTREITADGNGWVRWEWTIPATAQQGRWRMVVFGEESELQQHIDFDVLAPGTNEPATAHVEPLSGPAGTTFFFWASGFKAGELLEHWLTDPEGQTMSDEQPLYADEGGSVTLQWTSPPEALAGTWMMVIQGSRHRHTVEIAFTVEGPTQEVEPPQQYVRPSSGPPGTTFTFVMAELPPRAIVGWWATSPDEEVFDGGVDVQANANGRLVWEWTAPENAIPGQWLMTVDAKEYDDIERTITFDVTASDTSPPPPPAPSYVTPERGPPGTTFTFETTELVPDENVGYWLTAPDKTVHPAPDEGEVNLSADEQGRLTWTWTAPEDALTGQWVMVVQSTPVDDVTANSHITIPFTIEYP
jgi:hypothetical protein